MAVKNIRSHLSLCTRNLTFEVFLPDRWDFLLNTLRPRLSECSEDTGCQATPTPGTLLRRATGVFIRVLIRFNTAGENRLTADIIADKAENGARIDEQLSLRAAFVAER